MPSAFDAELTPEVLASARSGSSHALEIIYRMYEGPVYTLARRLCRDPDAACDIAHDSFLRAFAKLAQFRGDAPFGHWLRSIVATEALMRLRDARRFLDFLDPDIRDDRIPDLATLSNIDLERALALLSATPRAVLWLYHVEGYSHPEIARLSGRTVSFSKSQLSRAHAKLRELLVRPDGEAQPASPRTLPRPAP